MVRMPQAFLQPTYNRQRHLVALAHYFLDCDISGTYRIHTVDGPDDQT